MKKICMILTLIICACSTAPKYLSFDDALGTGIQKIGNDLPEGTQVAILDFKSDNEILSSYIIEELYDKLINLRKLVIMERSRTNIIAMEVGYQLSGEVDDNQIINIGKQLGADYVVTGQIIFSGEAYRLRVFAIDIENGRRAASSSLNINQNDKQITYLLGNTNSTANKNKTENNNIQNSLIGNWFNEDDDSYLQFLHNNILAGTDGDGNKVAGTYDDKILYIEYQEFKALIPYKLIDGKLYCYNGELEFIYIRK